MLSNVTPTQVHTDSPVTTGSEIPSALLSAVIAHIAWPSVSNKQIQINRQTHIHTPAVLHGGGDNLRDSLRMSGIGQLGLSASGRPRTRANQQSLTEAMLSGSPEAPHPSHQLDSTYGTKQELHWCKCHTLQGIDEEQRCAHARALKRQPMQQQWWR